MLRYFYIVTLMHLSKPLAFPSDFTGTHFLSRPARELAPNRLSVITLSLTSMGTSLGGLANATSKTYTIFYSWSAFVLIGSWTNFSSF